MHHPGGTWGLDGLREREEKHTWYTKIPRSEATAKKQMNHRTTSPAMIEPSNFEPVKLRIQLSLSLSLSLSILHFQDLRQAYWKFVYCRNFTPCMSQMIGALCLCLSSSPSSRQHRLDNQCRPVPGFLTDPGPVRATSPLRETGLGSAHLSGTRRDLKSAMGPYRRSECTSPPVGRFVNRMGCFFHPAPDPLLTNLVLQATFLGCWRLVWFIFLGPFFPSPDLHSTSWNTKNINFKYSILSLKIIKIF
jgi:hypothetical protein